MGLSRPLSVFGSFFHVSKCLPYRDLCLKRRGFFPNPLWLPALVVDVFLSFELFDSFVQYAVGLLLSLRDSVLALRSGDPYNVVIHYSLAVLHALYTTN